jgi:hypothetical protein
VGVVVVVLWSVFTLSILYGYFYFYCLVCKKDTLIWQIISDHAKQRVPHFGRVSRPSAWTRNVSGCVRPRRLGRHDQHDWRAGVRCEGSWQVRRNEALNCIALGSRVPCTSLLHFYGLHEIVYHSHRRSCHKRGLRGPMMATTG